MITSLGINAFSCTVFVSLQQHPEEGHTAAVPPILASICDIFPRKTFSPQSKDFFPRWKTYFCGKKFSPWSKDFSPRWKIHFHGEKFSPRSKDFFPRWKTYFRRENIYSTVKSKKN